MNIVVFETDITNKADDVSCVYDTTQEKTVKCSKNVSQIDFSKENLDCCEVDVTLGINVESLARESFSNNTSLTAIDIRNVQEIPYRCFYQCSELRRVTGINNVTSIGEDAFTNCEHLAFELDNQSLTSIGNRAFWRCFDITGDVTIQEVNSIGASAFYKCTGITSVTVDKMASIGDSAFGECRNVGSVDLGQSTFTAFPARCFYNCVSLTAIDLENTVIDSVGTDCLCNTRVRSICLPTSLTTTNGFQQNCFRGISLETLELKGFDDDYVKENAEWFDIEFFGTSDVFTVVSGSGRRYKFKDDGKGLKIGGERHAAVVLTSIGKDNKGDYDLSYSCAYNIKYMIDCLRLDSTIKDEDIYPMIQEEFKSTIPSSVVGNWMPPTKQNIRDVVEKLLWTSDDNAYDLVTIYMMDHGSPSGSIGVQGGAITTAILSDLVVKSNPNTRIHLIIDCCFAGALDPQIQSSSTNSYTSIALTDLDRSIQERIEFEVAKHNGSPRMMTSTTPKTERVNLEPKLLCWFTCPRQYVGFFDRSEKPGANFAYDIYNEVIKHPDQSYKDIFRILPSYYYYERNVRGDVKCDYGGRIPYDSDMKPKKKFGWKLNWVYRYCTRYHDNFDDTEKVFR